MPAYMHPNSDITRLAMLRRCVERITDHEANGQTNPIPADVTAQLKQLLPEFEAALTKLQAETETRQDQVIEGEIALNKLKLYIRHMWQVVKNRVIRQNLPASFHTYYGLTLAGDLPNPSTREAWMELAQTMIAGDKRAVDKVHAPIAEPTAVELQAVLDEVKKEVSEVVIARDVTEKSLKAVQGMRTAVDHALQEVVHALNYHHRNDTPAQIRNQIRLYGGQYRYYEGEEEPEV